MVKKKIVITAFAIMCVMFVIGLVLIFSAPSIGSNAGSVTIRNNGGSMDTNQYERIIDTTTISYRTGGLVISLVSGFGSLASGYAFYKEM